MAVLFMLLSINLDSLVAGFSYGMRKVHIPLLSAAIISGFSVFYSAMAIIIGSSFAKLMPPLASRISGSVILVFIGICVIINSFRGEKEQVTDNITHTLKPFNLSIKSLGITISVIRDPSICDFDASKTIDPREAVYLSFALSADAIGVGLGCALSGITNAFLPFCIGLSQLILLYGGVTVGRFLSRFLHINKTFCEVVAGVLLILLAAVRFFMI